MASSIYNIGQLGKSLSATSTFKCRGSTAAVLFSGSFFPGLRIHTNSFMFISDIGYKPESLCRWWIWHEFVFVCIQRGPPEDEDLLFLSFWTNFRKNWGFPINISLILVVLLYSWVVDVNIRLIITETYLEPSRTVIGLFPKIVNGWKPLTISMKLSSTVDVELCSKCATGLGFYQTILLSWLFIYIRTSKMLQKWPCILLWKNCFLKILKNT